MARAIHVFRTPDRFVAGTVGQPGNRTFYIQAVHDARVVSVVLEKQQVAVLAERIGALLIEVNRRFGTPVPPEPTEVDDLSPLVTPVDAEFRVGTMGLGWDSEAQTVVVELLAVTDAEFDASVVLDDTEEGPDAVRVFLTPESARQFATRSNGVISAGRPPCPLCDEPLDPEGHICARTNGYRRGRCSGRTMTRGEHDDREALRRRRADGPRTHPLGQQRHLSVRGDAGRRTACTASTNRSPVSSRCGTSRTARWPVASWPRTWCRRPGLEHRALHHHSRRARRPRHAAAVGGAARRHGGSRSEATERGPTSSTCFPPDKRAPGYLPVLRAYDYAGDEVTLVHADDVRLRRMAVFDVLINNADRKGGHILAGVDGDVYGVDHGVSLHVEDKLRTVLWGWAGKPIDDETLRRSPGWPTRSAARSPTSCAGTSPAAEVDALRRRAVRCWTIR